MSTFIDKIKDAIFVDPDNEIIENEEAENTMEDIYEDQNVAVEREAVREPRIDRRRGGNAGNNKVVNMDKPNLTAVNGAGTMKMILFQPLAFEESQAIVDNLRARKPVIVNMVDLERELAQRVIDFMSGAVYALSGTIRRVSYGIFVIVPSNIQIVGDGDDEERELFRS